MGALLRPVGYYIAELVPKPAFCHLPCSLLLSCSPCMGSQHPELCSCFWLGHERERLEYRQRLGMNDAEFGELCSETARLFNENRLDVDGRFLCLEDALRFYVRFIDGRVSARVVCLACPEQLLRKLWEEGDLLQNLGTFPDALPSGELLGGEILGADHGSFHSWLCNGLERLVAERFSLRVDQFGLIQNGLEEMAQFAEFIEGKGEPVCWIPFLYYDCTPTK